MTKELSREQIEDLRNEICAENGWIAAEIPRFHALCDMALRSSSAGKRKTLPEGLEIVVSDNTIWLCADSGDRKGMVNLRIVCSSESIANSAFNRVCDKAVSALAPADGSTLDTEPVRATRVYPWQRCPECATVAECASAGTCYKLPAPADGNAERTRPQTEGKVAYATASETVVVPLLPDTHHRQAISDTLMEMKERMARGEEINWLAMPYELWKAVVATPAVSDTERKER